jgi:hypothetical protein
LDGRGGWRRGRPSGFGVRGGGLVERRLGCSAATGQCHECADTEGKDEDALEIHDENSFQSLIP